MKLFLTTLTLISLFYSCNYLENNYYKAKIRVQNDIVKSLNDKLITSDEFGKILLKTDTIELGKSIKERIGSNIFIYDMSCYDEALIFHLDKLNKELLSAYEGRDKILVNEIINGEEIKEKRLNDFKKKKEYIEFIDFIFIDDFNYRIDTLANNIEVKQKKENTDYSHNLIGEKIITGVELKNYLTHDSLYYRIDRIKKQLLDSKFLDEKFNFSIRNIWRDNKKGMERFKRVNSVRVGMCSYMMNIEFNNRIYSDKNSKGDSLILIHQIQIKLCEFKEVL